jgi:prepilin-type N-terminal cleavage/methylation domain-containing protein
MVRSRLRDERGVTLLELVVALGLLAVALASVYGYAATGGRSAQVTNDLLQTQNQVRAALDNLVDEIRWAQSVTAANATSVTLFVPQNTPFSAASPYTVTFAYDAAADTVTRQEDPDAGGPLPAAAPEPLAFFVVQRDGSNGFALSYYDAAGTALGATPPDLSAVVRVRLTVTTTRNGISRTFAGDTTLRGR